MLNGRIRTTALVLTYNQEDSIEEAIRSVAEQSVQPDEIFVSDDCSTDATYESAQNTLNELVSSGAFKGSVRHNKNKENLGFIPHFNWAVQACSGELILYNAGDDISMPDRLKTFMTAYEHQGSPKYFLGHSSARIKGGLQDGGIWVPPIKSPNFSIDRISNSPALHIGATQCFTKSLFKDFGPIRFNDSYEDLILGFRAFLTKSYWYSHEPLLTYRVGGLTFWQNNSWERKRRRYEAVLSQRSLDSLKYGRPDLVKEIALVYQDYGFSLSPHPDCIDVYSCDAIEESIFDYSIEEHFHRLPHHIKRHPLEEFFSNHVRGNEAFNKERTLVFLRLPLLGWQRVIFYLSLLNGLGTSTSVDCGVSINSLDALETSPELRDNVQNLFLKNKTFKITSACPVVGEQLKKLFNGAFVSSPLLMDVDGPSAQRDPNRRGDSLKVLLACTLKKDFAVDLNLLETELKELEVEYKVKSCQLFIPSTMLKTLRHLVSKLSSDTYQIFEIRNCRKNQFVGFDHVILVKDGQEQEAVFLKNLEWQATSQSIPISILSNEAQYRCVTKDQFDLKRSTLYFSDSIQKRVVCVLDVLTSLLSSSQLFSNVRPL